MGIKLIDLFHGAVLSKITRNGKNTLKLLEWDNDDRAIYKVSSGNKDFEVLVKYQSKARDSKTKSVLSWYFNNIAYKKGRCYALACTEDREISGKSTKEICFISPIDAEDLFTQEEKTSKSNISFSVSLQKNSRLTVTRKKEGISFSVPRNAIDKI